MKKKIAFAALMGIITTGIITFTVIGFNVGFVANFLVIWLRSWLIAYVVSVPLILVIAPQIEKLVNYFLKETVKS